MLGLFTRRYLFSQKSTKAINIISWVSIIAIALGTAALLIVLSVFNGLSHFIEGLYNCLYTDVIITPKEAKYFEPDSKMLASIKNIDGVLGYSLVLEDNVLLQSENAQSIVTLKGVDQQFAPLTGLNANIKYGDSALVPGEPTMIAGIGVANQLQTNEQSLRPIRVFSLNDDADLNAAPQDAYMEIPLYITGIFVLQDELDRSYCITDIGKAREVLNQPTAISSIAINKKEGASTKKILKQLNSLLPSHLKIVTKQEQNKTLYYILKSEKWMSYAILSFILIIAAFNIIASMSMLVMEKKKDIKILQALGGSNSFIRKLFQSTGVGIGIIGALIGIVLAILFCVLQSKFHLLKMGDGSNLLLTHYPVQMMLSDFIIVLFTVLGISWLAAYVPARRAAQLKTNT